MAAVSPLDSLTVQQRRILALALEGYSRTEIALRCGIAPNTVKRHLEDIRDRLGCVGQRGWLLHVAYQLGRVAN